MKEENVLLAYEYFIRAQFPIAMHLVHALNRHISLSDHDDTSPSQLLCTKHALNRHIISLSNHAYYVSYCARAYKKKRCLAWISNQGRMQDYLKGGGLEKK